MVWTALKSSGTDKTSRLRPRSSVTIRSRNKIISLDSVVPPAIDPGSILPSSLPPCAAEMKIRPIVMNSYG